MSKVLEYSNRPLFPYEVLVASSWTSTFAIEFCQAYVLESLLRTRTVGRCHIPDAWIEERQSVRTVFLSG
jgi:hypothetical protein